MRETESVIVDGPMAAGTRGRLKPVKGPAARFTFTQVTPGVGFANVTRLPLARLTFDHRIEPDGDGSRVTHSVRIDGPLTPLFVRLIGRSTAAGLPAVMRALARRAEGVRETDAVEG